MTTNDTIQQSRQIALDALSVSERDLECGLELHADSVVIDAYGFGAYAAVDYEPVRAELSRGASRRELKDLIEDMQFTRQVYDTSERDEFLLAWQSAGVTCVMKNSGEESNSVAILIKRMAHNIYATDVMKDVLCKATSATDIREAKKRNQSCYCLTTNGIPLAEQWESVEGELSFIRTFRHLGVRMMHVTYNRRNLIGDGCAESSDAGLSDLGRAAIAELNRLDIIPDVAHCGLQTTLEVAKISEKPVVASHTACRQLNDHCRNKSDDTIRAIAQSGGVVGVCCVPAFLGGTGNIHALLDHIDYLATLVGTDHIAIGTDRPYFSTNNSSQDPPSLGPHRKRYQSFWPPHDAVFMDEWNRPEQIKSLAWTNWPLFTVGLVQRGYRHCDIRKILGGNIFRLL